MEVFMGAVPSHEFVRNLDDAILPDLWRRRTRLSGDEMVSMVELVKRALRTYHPLELQALGEDKEELVAQFIYAKVLRLAPGHTETHACADSAPSNGYALCAYFRRYLIDCLRSAGHQRNVSMENDGMAQEIDLHAQALEDPVESVLLQYGLDEQRVRYSARAFIESLDEPERIVLAGSLGAASCALVSLSRRQARRHHEEDGRRRRFFQYQDRPLAHGRARHRDRRRQSPGDSARAEPARRRIERQRNE
jgi:hypothetical protein